MKPGMFDIELTEPEFESFRALIYRIAGIRIPDTKRVMVTNRLRRRLRDTGIDSFAKYYAYLNSGAGQGEVPRFLDAITTNETYFFRDPHQYEWFGETFLPEVARAVPDASEGKEPSGLVGRLRHGRGTLLDRSEDQGASQPLHRLETDPARDRHQRRRAQCRPGGRL